MWVGKRETLGCRLFGLLNFEWHGQSQVGNIVILMLWRDPEKL